MISLSASISCRGLVSLLWITPVSRRRPASNRRVPSPGGRDPRLSRAVDVPEGRRGGAAGAAGADMAAGAGHGDGADGILPGTIV
ncbi:hypothetical protein ACRBEV_18940 [Methylobacterium phyllosphaerae]